MPQCAFCNTPFERENAKFCSQCATSVEDFEGIKDRPEALDRYRRDMALLVFNFPDEDLSTQYERLRKELKISFEAGKATQKKLNEELSDWKTYRNCLLEFDENVTDAYAGHDTYLRFRFTNYSQEILKSVRLTWDDPETPDQEDLDASKGPFKANQTELIGTAHVFQRAGPKQIGGLFVTLEGFFGKKIRLKAEAFEFVVLNPNQSIINSVSNTTQISIEGRGVVDASGRDSQIVAATPNKGARWKKLNLILAPIEAPVLNEPGGLNKLASTVQVQVVKPADVPESVTPMVPNAAVSTADATDSLRPPENIKEAVESLFNTMRKFASCISGEENKHLTPVVDLSLNFLDALLDLSGSLKFDDLVGLAFKNPDTVHFDLRDFVEGFEGEATLFTVSGLQFLRSERGIITCVDALEWAALPARDQDIRCRKFGNNSFLVFFGDRKGNDLPGLMFDLRRYTGTLPIETLFSDATEMMSAVRRLIPLKTTELAPSHTLELAKPEDKYSKFINSLVEQGQDYTAESLDQATTDLCSVLSYLCTVANVDPCKFTLASHIDKPLLEKILVHCPDEEFAKIKALFISDTTDVVDPFIDDTDLLPIVVEFSGDAVVVTAMGLLFISSKNGLVSYERHYSWGVLSDNGIRLSRCDDAANLVVFRFLDPEKRQVPIINFEFLPNTDQIYIANSASPIFEVVKDRYSAEGTYDDELDTNEDEDLEVEDEFSLGMPENDEINCALNSLFTLFSFALQGCSEGSPKAVFCESEMSETHRNALHLAANFMGSGMRVVCVEPTQVELSYDGKLSGWRGFASVLSAEGVFHMLGGSGDDYQLDGKNNFLSWEKFFCDLHADLQIREKALDLWIGTPEKMFLRNTYVSFSNNVTQWDYFEEFMKSELIRKFEEFKNLFAD